MVNVGAWDEFYEELVDPEPYGGDLTYRFAADWVKDCATVEDWGCGKGWLRQFIPPERYRGLDGSCSPFADEVVDLAIYRSKVEGIVLRHVLEHDYRWSAILDNALASFTKRLCVILFTPPAEETHVMHTEPDYHDVPVIAFRLNDLLAPIHDTGAVVEVVAVDGASAYGSETLLCVRR